MNEPRRGLKLSEMMVIIFLIALFMGIFVTPAPNGHNHSPRAQCQNNMRNVGLALVQFSISKNHFPTAGTFVDDPDVHGGDPTRSTIYRAITTPASAGAKPSHWLHSWVVDVSPYLDQQDLYNSWNQQEPYLSRNPQPPYGISNAVISSTSIRILSCPDDPTWQPGQGNLSYVVNGGFARWYPIPVGWSGGAKDGQSKNGGVLHWADGDQRVSIGRSLGVMFLGTHTGDQPWDIKTTVKDITDGHSMTLLLGENTLAGYSKGTPYSGGLPTNWGCPLPNFTMFVGSDDICRSSKSETDCLAGQLQPGHRGETGAGWSWANHAKSFERINYGAKLSVEGSFPFINSGHTGGSNFVFCDGSVRFLSSSIDGKVFAELVTPAGAVLPPTIRQAPTPLRALDP